MNESIQTAYGQFRAAIEGQDIDWPLIQKLIPIFEEHDIRLTVAQIIEDKHEVTVDPFTVDESQWCEMWANQTLRDAGLPHVTYFRSKWSR